MSFVSSVTWGPIQTFTGTLTGCTAPVLIPFQFQVSTNLAMVWTPASDLVANGTSNSTAMTITGIAPQLIPVSTATSPFCQVVDAGSVFLALFSIVGTTWVFRKQVPTTGIFSPTGFTASGTKGLTNSGGFFALFNIN